MNKSFYICPKCGYDIYCGCESCKKNNPPGVKTKRGTGCPNCGFDKGPGWWMDYEWDLALEAGKLDPKYSNYVFEDWDGIEINYI